MKRWMRKRLFLSAVLLIAAIAISLTTLDSRAQDKDDIAPVPIQLSPYQLVSNLDLACNKVEGGQTPVRSMTINHLNPVLLEMGLKQEQAHLGRLEQLCVPVAKNQVIPPKPAYAYVRWIDLACYEAESEISPVANLKLTHLNPVLRELGLPPEKVAMGRLEQVCLPVAKNGVTPPEAIKRIIEHVDVACYAIDPYTNFEPIDLHLTHLNPVLRRMGLVEEKVEVIFPEQLCVPVAKNGKKPPEDVLRYIQWIDLKKYEAKPSEIRQPIRLTLSHLNPQLLWAPRFPIEMLVIDQLAVPVAKNDRIPPDWYITQP